MKRDLVVEFGIPRLILYGVILLYFIALLIFGAILPWVYTN
jgi:hypothetical protein